MNVRYWIRVLPLALFCFTSCFLAERDNENDPSSSDYEITGQVSSATGNVLAGHETITIKFDDAMNPDNISFTGSDLIEGNYILTWSTEKYRNDLLTISMNPSRNKAFLVEGSNRKIVVNSKTSVTFNVENRIYVRTASDGGADSNSGTAKSPVATIMKGIDLAKSVYSGSPAKVLVAEGTYTNNSDTSSPVFEVSEGISVCGGYAKSDWSRRDISVTGAPSSYETIVENSCTSVDTAITMISSAILIPCTVSSATILEGLTIKPGRGRDDSHNNMFSHAAILCHGSPVIRNNYLPGRLAGDNPGNNMYGIYCEQDLNVEGSQVPSPQISNNTIYAGANASAINDTIAQSDYAAFFPDESCAVYLSGSSATIEGNIIDGGSGKRTTGVYCLGECTPLIKGNTISGGQGMKIIVPDMYTDGGAWSIRLVFATPRIEENRIINKYMAIDWYGIYEEDDSSDPSSVLGNIFIPNGPGYLYRDEGLTDISCLTANITNSRNGTLSAWGNSVP